MSNQLTKLEQFTLAAMQVLITVKYEGKPLSTHDIAKMAVKQAKVQLNMLALEEDNNKG